MKISESMHSTKESKTKFLIPVLLIIIVTIIIYSNTLKSSFHFDDFNNIVENEKVHVLSNALHSFDNRYVGNLSFALNYFFGGANVIGYHIVNIIIHIINGILVLWFVSLIFKTPAMEGSAGNSRLNSFIALTSALIFVAHPVQTQAVTYIVQRLTSLSVLFYLLSIVLFVKWRLSSGHKARVVFYILSLFSVVIAMKTKEISFTLPAVILLFEFVFFKGTVRRLFSIVPFLLTCLIIPLNRININKPIGDIVEHIGRISLETVRISRSDYLLTQFRVIITYIRLLFLPVNQNLDYDYPIYHSLFNPEVLLSLLFLLFIVGLAVYLFILYRKRNNGYALIVSFGIFWFFITLSVESSIIPIFDVIFEHRLYLPSVGAALSFSTAALLGGYGLRRVFPKISPSIICWCILSICVVPLSFASYQRNFIWKDEITLWADVVRKSPLKARGHNNLGFAYFKIGQIDEAIARYKTAISLDSGRVSPDIIKALNNLGIAYVQQNNIKEAIMEYNTAIMLKPDDASAYSNLGYAYLKQDRIDEAIMEYNTAIKLKPGDAGIHNDLGLAYKKKGRIDESIEEFKNSLRLNSGFAEAHNNLGISYAEHGWMDEAIEEFSTALRLKPDYVNAFNNLNIAYRKNELKERKP